MKRSPGRRFRRMGLHFKGFMRAVLKGMGNQSRGRPILSSEICNRQLEVASSFGAGLVNFVPGWTIPDPHLYAGVGQLLAGSESGRHSAQPLQKPRFPARHFLRGSGFCQLGPDSPYPRFSMRVGIPLAKPR